MVRPYIVSLYLIALIELMIVTRNIATHWYIFAIFLFWIIISQVRMAVNVNIRDTIILLLFELLAIGNLFWWNKQVVMFVVLASGLTIVTSKLPIWAQFIYGISLLTISSIIMLQLTNPYWFWIPIFIIIWLMIYQKQQETNELEKALSHQREMTQTLASKVHEVEEQISTSRKMHILLERDRISRELHDSVGHSLSTIIIQLGAIEKLTEKEQPQVSEMVKNLRQFSNEGLQNVRKVVHDLKPQHLEELTIIASLEEFFNEVKRNSQLTIKFRHNQPMWVLNEQQMLMIYRMVQEFTVNTQKYAKATQITATLIYQEKELVLTLQDNGVGTDQIVPRMGLESITKRAEALGGKIQMTSAKGEGMKLRLVLFK